MLVLFTPNPQRTDVPILALYSMTTCFSSFRPCITI